MVHFNGGTSNIEPQISNLKSMEKWAEYVTSLEKEKYTKHSLRF